MATDPLLEGLINVDPMTAKNEAAVGALMSELFDEQLREEDRAMIARGEKPLYFPEEFEQEEAPEETTPRPTEAKTLNTQQPWKWWP